MKGATQYLGAERGKHILTYASWAISKLVWFAVISFHGQIVPSQIVPQNSQFVPNMKSQLNLLSALSLYPKWFKNKQETNNFVVLF